MGSGKTDSIQVVVIYKSEGGTAPRERGASPALSPAAVLRSRARAARPGRKALPLAPGQGREEDVKDLWVVNGYGLAVSPDALKLLSQDPRVEAVFENFQVQTPELLPLSEGILDEDPANWGLEKTGASQVWDLFGLTGRGVRIGHLDTGVDAGHPDLQGKIAAWAEFDADGALVPGSRPHDNGLHGTHTAGTLVGGSAGGGPVGVAPDARLISAKVLGAAGGTLLQVLAGMQWVLDPDNDPATDDGAHILNMSLGAAGRYEVFDVLVDRLLDAGVLPVFAIGNGGKDLTTAPANSPRALGVGATTADDRVAVFSGSGETLWQGQKYLKPEIAAPGYGIRSAIPGGGYRSASGTSMAAPHVAGAAALILQARPGMAPEDLQKLLRETAADIGAPGVDARSGAGRLDVLSAVSRAAGVAVLTGATRAPQGPIPALIRVKDAQGNYIKTLRADSQTGRFQLSLSRGEYTVEGLFGAANVRKTVRVSESSATQLDLFFDGAASDVENLLVFPNPFKPARGDRRMTFFGLPEGSVVQIYSLSGELVKELKGFAAGEHEWDAANDNGEPVAAGLYFYVARARRDAGGWDQTTGKVAVIR